MPLNFDITIKYYVFIDINGLSIVFIIIILKASMVWWFYCTTLEWTLDRSLEVIFTTNEVTVLGIPNYWHKSINNHSEYSYWLHTSCNWRQGDRGVFNCLLQRLGDIFHQKAHLDINRDNSKLRTYKELKKSLGMEKYLLSHMSCKEHISLTRATNMGTSTWRNKICNITHWI